MLQTGGRWALLAAAAAGSGVFFLGLRFALAILLSAFLEDGNGYFWLLQGAAIGAVCAWLAATSRRDLAAAALAGFLLSWPVGPMDP